jgi:fatty acid CoA ligase FadD21
MLNSSILSLLRERAGLEPDGTALTIIELKKRGDSDEQAMRKLRAVRNDVTAAISRSHGLNVADLVLVPPGSIRTTTSGKIRRAACAEQYRLHQFTRLDV